MNIQDLLFVALPLLPSLIVIWGLLHEDRVHLDAIKPQLVTSCGISLLGYGLTSALIPLIATYTLKRGICGKDLGKKGVPELADRSVPEALGLVSGTVFIICAIFSQLCFASTEHERMIYNSALFSICFMVFLGFCDDTLDLAWRCSISCIILHRIFICPPYSLIHA